MTTSNPTNEETTQPVQVPSATKRAARSVGAWLGLGVLACAACCAIPILGSLGVGAALLASIGVATKSTVLVLSVLGLLTVSWVIFRMVFARA